jgi:hypothetical protein
MLPNVAKRPAIHLEQDLHRCDDFPLGHEVGLAAPSHAAVREVLDPH